MVRRVVKLEGEEGGGGGHFGGDEDPFEAVGVGGDGEEKVPDELHDGGVVGGDIVEEGEEGVEEFFGFVRVGEEFEDIEEGGEGVEEVVGVLSVGVGGGGAGGVLAEDEFELRGGRGEGVG